MKRNIIGLCTLWCLTLIISSCSNEDTIAEMPGYENTVQTTTKISIEEAQSDLETLIGDLYASNSRTGNNSNLKKIKSSYSLSVVPQNSRAGESETTEIHIFNFENNEGYAIMSGDNRLPSLISITDSGTLEDDEEIDDPGVALFLEGMENLNNDRNQDNSHCPVFDDTDGSSNGGSSVNLYNVYGDWKNIVYNNYGVCPVKWDQGSPYNNYCPIKNDIPTYTGCVATAVAQLMACFNYPNSYNGFNFSWDEMTSNKYGYSCSPNGQNDIARLMQQLGSSENLNVTYGTDSSSAKSKNIIRTLKSFGYTQSGTLSDYKTENVIEDLKKGYGVLICGYSNKTVTRVLGIKVKTKYSGGHQWLAHGLLERKREIEHYTTAGTYVNSSYESQWYPLCNWGWSGHRDGYYLSAAFDTNSGYVFHESEVSSRSGDPSEGTSPYNYQYKISSITGIRK